MTGPTIDDRHEQHHRHLAELQEKIDRIEASAYTNAKRMRAHAPRKFARRSAHSQRVTQVAAWRSHLQEPRPVRWTGRTARIAR